MTLLRTVGLASFALLASACASDAEFHVSFASDVPRAGTNVSVLGVYRDGRLAPESWETMGPTLSAALGGGPCELEYDDALALKQAELAAAIDDYSRANGVTDALLDKLSTAAKGDVIVVFAVAGHAANKTEGPPPPSNVYGSSNSNLGPATSALGSSQSRGMGRQPRGALPRMQPIVGKTGTLDVSATLYSVSQHKALGVVALDYGGPSMDDALRRFAARMREELPQASCVGWNKTAKIDPESVRTLTE